MVVVEAAKSCASSISKRFWGDLVTPSKKYRGFLRGAQEAGFEPAREIPCRELRMDNPEVHPFRAARLNHSAILAFRLAAPTMHKPLTPPFWWASLTEVSAVCVSLADSVSYDLLCRCRVSVCELTANDSEQQEWCSISASYNESRHSPFSDWTGF